MRVCVRCLVVDLLLCCKRQKLVVEFHMGEIQYKELNERFMLSMPIDISKYDSPWARSAA